MNPPDPQIRDFILFCAKRRSPDWPQLYDEMVKVAGQRLFNGMGYTDLHRLGFSLCLNSLDKTVQQVKKVITCDYHG
jgi:hypothetical protein